MKNLIITIIFLLLCVSILLAQQTHTPNNLPTSVSLDNMTISPTSNKNYISTYTFLTNSQSSTLKTGEASVDIQYFDGVGRPIENVSIKASPSGKDIVLLQTYDTYGRANKSYMPYSSSTSGGVFVGESSVTSLLPTFLSSNFELLGTDGQYGFSKPAYDDSPLNRILQQGAPGTEWQPGQHPVQYSYLTNTSAITSWKYSGSSYSSVSYSSGKLYVTLTTDEDTTHTRTYTDMEGKVVMKEAYDGTQWLRTRYCYDDFGLLRCVLQPMASSPASSEYCFYYNYDSRHRLVGKKVPGGGWVYLIYDSRDRLALTSDENSRAFGAPVMKWYYNKYDDFNRPIETGYILTTTSNTSLVSYYATNTALYTLNGTIVFQHELMVYDLVPTTSPYSNCPFVANTLATTTERTTSNKGLLVAKQSSMLNRTAAPYLAITEVYYYDKYGRVIQTVRKNHLGYIERTSNDYNFTGQVIQTRTEHYYSSSNAFIVDVFNKYDHRGRLIQTDYQVDRNGINLVPRTIVSALVYNEAGQMKTKYLHSQNNLAFLQKIDYKYNVRGWLTGINDPALASGENDLFGLKLYYNRNTNGSTAYWNGNIKAQEWGVGGWRNQIQTYTYDHANRITSGNYPTGSNSTYSFLSTYGYDKNGNFTSLTRRGVTGAYIDQITYKYKGDNSNKLDYTTDASGDIAGVEDFPGTLTGTNHYQYDLNGNLIRDDYRSLNLSYNSFNMPYEVDFGNNQKVIYFYNGIGQKIAKEVQNGSNPTVHTDYTGQFVHEYNLGSTSSLKYILTPEGRLKNTGTNATPVWAWEYNLTDHLGNVRAVFRPATGNRAEVIEYNNYFPFGMKMTPYLCQTTTDNKYLYNGKEQQTDFGFNWYDYGARFYDPALARWHSIDPLAETYSSWSPYHYAMNNPIRYTDVFGMGAGNFYDEKGKYLGTDGQDDGRLYVVTDKQEKKQIQNTDKAGGTTSTSEVSSATELPSSSVRGEMSKAVDRAGSPSFHEEGGFFGTKEGGGEYVVHAEAGEKADPSVDPEASVNVFKAANKADLAATAGGTIDGTFHTHPDGTITTGTTGSNTIGGTITTSSFANEPSNINGQRGDIPNAKANTMGVTGNSYVLAQGNKTVYIYNGSGTVATFPFKQFFSIGINK